MSDSTIQSFDEWFKDEHEGSTFREWISPYKPFDDVFEELMEAHANYLTAMLRRIEAKVRA